MLSGFAVKYFYKIILFKKEEKNGDIKNAPGKQR